MSELTPDLIERLKALVAASEIWRHWWLLTHGQPYDPQANREMSERTALRDAAEVDLEAAVLPAVLALHALLAAVAELQHVKPKIAPGTASYDELWSECADAEAERDALQAEVGKLRAALRDILNWGYGADAPVAAARSWELARAALAEEAK